MGTTDLVVELMVIGVGAVLAVLLSALAVFGIPSVPFENFLAVQTVVPILAINYVLGILIDRLADKAFERWSTEIRKNYFPGPVEYHAARRTILTKSEPIAAVMRYGRSRIRVVRGWTLNGVLLALSGTAFIAVRVDDIALLLTIYVLSTAALTGGCLMAWYRLSDNEYLKIREAAAFLNENSS